MGVAIEREHLAGYVVLYEIQRPTFVAFIISLSQLDSLDSPPRCSIVCINHCIIKHKRIII